MSSKEKTIGMKEGSNPMLVPKLRFPEFRAAEGWHLITLGSVCEILNNRRRPISSSERTPGPYPYYGASGIVDYVADFIFDERLLLVGEDGAKWGAFESTAFIATGRYWVNNHAHVLKPCGLSDTLLAQYLTLLDLSPFVTGAAPPKLTLAKLKSIPIPLPSKPVEQRKIAECLSSLDEAIAAQARKVDALKKQKKGLMQQLFPRQGETQPRLRFPEFQDAREWEVKAVGDVFRTTRGQVLPMSSVKEEPSPKAPYPVYSSQTKNMGLAGYYSDYLFEDAITWTTDGANAGDVNFRSGRFYCTNVCGVLLNSQGYANACVAALLNSVTRSHVSYVGNPKLMNGVMAQIEIPFPPLAEQHRIASCLSSLDALITTEAEKLETLKTHKRGLMQQLFPSRAEDNA